MAKSELDQPIPERIDAFVPDVSALVRLSALEAVRDALGGGAAPARRGPGRPRKNAAAPAAPRRKAGRKKAAKKKTTKKSGGRRVRRSGEDLEAAKAKILATIAKNPGIRMEELSAKLGQASKVLRRPLQMLLEDKAVRSKGAKRATAYTAK